LAKWLTPNVWKLSLVSLFTDISSEMLYPILPLYMQKIGLSGTLIGLIEGLAEAIAAWTKGYIGSMSQYTGKKKTYIVTGYGLSAVSKLLMAFSIFPALLYISRLSDRLGKGIRSTPRDAVLASESANEHLGKIFGFHRSMDTIGAAIGPAITLAMLYFFNFEYIQIFLYAFIPGVLGWFITLLIRETPSPIQSENKPRPSYFSFLKYYKVAPSAFKKTVIVLLIFALFNSSDFFLILSLKNNGFNHYSIVLFYVLYNISFALFSFPAGWLADKIGFKYIYILGLMVFAICYAFIGTSSAFIAALGLFILYGLFSALTDGIAKAWLSSNCNKEDKSQALGLFNFCQAIAIIISGIWTGLVVDLFSYQTAFIFSAAGAILSIVILLSTKLAK